LGIRYTTDRHLKTLTQMERITITIKFLAYWCALCLAMLVTIQMGKLQSLIIPEILPNPLALIFSKKLTEDFHINHLAIRQLELTSLISELDIDNLRINFCYFVIIALKSYLCTVIKKCNIMLHLMTYL